MAAVLRVRRGRGVRHERGQMNRLERAYGEMLMTRKLAGEIAEYHFEAVKFRLADLTYYTPDFMVMLPDGLIEFHEVKGFWEDDARVKIKVAAEIYPFKFVAASRLAKKLGGGWKFEEF